MFSKKTAVAAAALLAAFAAQAQSQVSIYGNLDVSVGRFEEPGTDSVTAVESGSLRQSFIGFKGTEDLGAGLKAFFVLESAIGVDDGTSTTGQFWGRTSVVGLNGDFGTVAIGNARTLLFQANDAFNPFRADSGLFSTSVLLQSINNATYNGVTVDSGYRSNFSNSITYTSPNLSGFTAAVQWSASENSNIDDAYSLALNYGAGPLAVNLTFQELNVNANDDIKTWLLGGSYDFGAVKLFGQYGQADQSVLDEKEKFYQLGVSIPVTSAGNILVSYGEAKVDDAKAKEFSVAYDHSLSKRTGAYIGVNNTRHNYLATDKSGTSFAVGVRHAF